MLKLGLATIAAIVIATPAMADDWDFVLINNTGKAIKTVEIAPTGTTTWQPNKIDPDFKKDDATVKSGARMTVHFNKGTVCKYDLKLNFADNSNSVWMGINVCDNSYVTVKYNPAGATVFTAN
ncbi:hypothetical protein JMG10_17055 [Nostoc ellipsosporum NOK]|uniref:hypothetical protein n=1 Tax=Sphingomonas sp. IBVSS2 TaxID=1985172 RepID=UPI000A2D35F6|nr:hypothetical protein [Sphingomonas sp. IBVSS2]MDF2383195.1 hypothetical protein [Nostoc ellipsosporum NOK]OSZ69500.1 hypothetical protein CAP40_01165 [Sphingomonas sp. IBVSS2]